MRRIIAQRAVANFLQQPINAIGWEILTGGSIKGFLVKCTYGSTSYVVKFFSSSKAGRDEIAWTQHAWHLGIGPRFYCADPDNMYMIIEFVQGDSLTPAVAHQSNILKSIAENVAKLHQSSFSCAYGSDTFVRIYTKYQRLHCSAILKDRLERSLRYIKKIEEDVQSFDVAPSPCHYDLNSGNIFVYNNHVTIIDWGDAVLGNCYYDIAAFLVLNCIDVENEKLFLTYYDIKFADMQWYMYMQLLKQLVYFEFSLNLLQGVQANSEELLHAKSMQNDNSLDDYLTLFAHKTANVDNDFLYSMAIASLAKMSLSESHT